MKHLLLGDEAIAQGAIDAGLSGVYAYPGTPSTEITEYIQRVESLKAKVESLECKGGVPAEQYTTIAVAEEAEIVAEGIIVNRMPVATNECAY